MSQGLVQSAVIIVVPAEVLLGDTIGRAQFRAALIGAVVEADLGNGTSNSSVGLAELGICLLNRGSFILCLKWLVAG